MDKAISRPHMPIAHLGIVCKNCGKKISKEKAIIKNKVIYCSPECQREYMELAYPLFQKMNKRELLKLGKRIYLEIKKIRDTIDEKCIFEVEGSRYYRNTYLLHTLSAKEEILIKNLYLIIKNRYRVYEILGFLVTRPSNEAAEQYYQKIVVEEEMPYEEENLV